MKILHHCGVCLFLIACWSPGLHDRCDALQTATASSTVGDQEEGNNSLRLTSRPHTKFLLLQTDEFNNPVALQTATARYVLKNDKGEVQFEVSLESVIHIADASYFRSFQKRFERYDAVLYESLIKPKESESDEGALPSGFQILRQISAGTLGLAYKFEEVDYTLANMRNADLTSSEISERLANLEDNEATILIDLLAHMAQRINADRQQEQAIAEGDEQHVEGPEPIKFDFSILTDPDGIMKIRRLMAALLVNSGLLESPLPPSIHQLVIGDRNDRAMSILQEEFEKGKRRVAIFYGVGHMADFEKRLIENFGMELATVNWRNAWDLRDGAIEGAPLEGLIESTFRDSFKNKLRELAKGLQEKREKPDTAKSKESVDAADEAKIKALEDAIKAMEAKLKEMEAETDEKKGEKNSGDADKSGSKKKTKDDGAH